MFTKDSSAGIGREVHLQIIALLHRTAAISALASFASVACIAADSSVSAEVMDARLVVARYEQLVPPQRADILSAAGSAYRDLRRWPEALRVYRLGEQQYPGDDRFSAGEVRTLADSGDSGAALSRAEALLKSAHHDASLWLAAGYSARLAGKIVDALRYTDEALALQPASDEALRERIIAAEQLGAAHEALVLAESNPHLIASDQVRRLQGSDAAQLVRFGPLDPASPATRFVVIDRAIGDLDAQIAHLTDRDPATRAARLRARFDRLVAWRQRARMHDVVQDYEALCAEHVAVPGYVLAPVGDAYLYLREPEVAERLYQRSLASDPNNFETRVKLFYALIDAGQLDAATQLIDALNLQQSKWIWLKGYKTPIPNPKREITEQMVAEARLYRNALPAAQQLYTTLTEAAPMNAAYRLGLGETYVARGWLRRAQGEFEIARALDPATLEPGIAASTALNDISLQRYAQASTAISDLARQFPEVAEVRRAQREFSLYQRPEYSLSLMRTSAPAASVTQGNGLLSEISAFSSPIGYRWRVHAGASYGHERYAEGDITLRRAMLGIEYRVPDFVLQLDSTGSSYGVVRAGAELQATWNPNDTWQIDGKGARFSPGTPLRALLHGVTADSGEVNWTYRRSELMRATLGVGLMDFSDGNRGLGLKANLMYRVYTRPALTVDALVDLAGTRNSLPQQAYYSPARDFQSLLGVNIAQLFAHRYERYLKNNVTLQAGSYFERGYGSHWVERIADKLAYHANDALEIDFGLTFGRAVYDGLSQNEFSAAFSANWRI
jgi:biofilm PGA synthesis protein PgaA